jgi:hypothetical protein
MIHEDRPGRKMYVVVWELEGELRCRFATHAKDEADAISTAQSFFAEYPEHDFPGREGMTVSVRDAETFRNERQNPD